MSVDHEDDNPWDALWDYVLKDSELDLGDNTWHSRASLLSLDESCEGTEETIVFESLNGSTKHDDNTPTVPTATSFSSNKERNGIKSEAPNNGWLQIVGTASKEKREPTVSKHTKLKRENNTKKTTKKKSAKPEKSNEKTGDVSPSLLRRLSREKKIGDVRSKEKSKEPKDPKSKWWSKFSSPQNRQPSRNVEQRQPLSSKKSTVSRKTGTPREKPDGSTTKQGVRGQGETPPRREMPVKSPQGVPSRNEWKAQRRKPLSSTLSKDESRDPVNFRLSSSKIRKKDMEGVSQKSRNRVVVSDRGSSRWRRDKEAQADPEGAFLYSFFAKPDEAEVHNKKTRDRIRNGGFGEDSSLLMSVFGYEKSSNRIPPVPERTRRRSKKIHHETSGARERTTKIPAYSTKKPTSTAIREQPTETQPSSGFSFRNTLSRLEELTIRPPPLHTDESKDRTPRYEDRSITSNPFLYAGRNSPFEHEVSRARKNLFQMRQADAWTPADNDFLWSSKY